MTLYIAIAVSSVVLLWFFVHLKKRQDEVEANFQSKFADKNIKLLDKTALFIAQKSDGYSHSRGIGNLVLTDDELYFERRLITKVLEIPLSSIVEVGETNRLAGQGLMRPMLKIDFIDRLGETDTVGIQVKELALWKEVLSVSIGTTE